jgi:hypothetical protein
MIYEDSNERIKKVLLNIVEKAGCIVKEVSMWKQRIRTSRRCVGFIKTFAFWLNSTIENVIVVAYSSSGTVKRAK